MTSVFVSSVIRDFEEERKCARRAIEALRLIPVMAEEFGAQSGSPESVCLKYVEDSDIYLGILGPKYGATTTSGVSPTEQEYRHAITLQKDIVLFVQKCERDPQQERFVNEILKFESGHFAGFFATLDDLSFKITQALSDYCREQSSAIGHDKARVAIHDSIKSIASRSRECSIVLAAIPSDSRSAIPIESIVAPSVREEIQQHLLFGHFSLFERMRGYSVRDYKDGFSVLQGDDYEPTNELLVRACGPVAWVHRMTPRSTHFGAAFIIDREHAANCINSYLRFCDWYFDRWSKPRTRRIFVSSALCNLGYSKLGTPPNDQKRFTLSQSEIDDPLIVPDLPEEISLPAKNTEASTQKLMAYFEQAFRAAGRFAEG